MMISQTKKPNYEMANIMLDQHIHDPDYRY
jgi:hypothetical protein